MTFTSCVGEVVIRSDPDGCFAPIGPRVRLRLTPAFILDDGGPARGEGV